MKKYVVAAGKDWGVRVFDALDRLAKLEPHESWSVVVNHAELERITNVGPGHECMVFFLNWSDRVSARVVNRFECVNFHCTALPYGRGGHPIENLILRGHTETVLTAHRMTEGIDDGPVYCTFRPVSLAGTKDEILARFVWPCVGMVRHIVDARPVPKPQMQAFKRLSQKEHDSLWASRRQP